MTLRDRTRGRRTYSFFRSPPVPVATLASEETLKFDNLSALGAQSTTDLVDGEFAYVGTVRDFFMLQKTITSGSASTAERVVGTGGGMWHRLSLTEPYWRNQTTWFINADVGSDENLGAVDSPIKTHDELVRRIFGTGKIRSDYTVNLTSLTASVAANYAIDLELEGGSVTYVGRPGFIHIAIGMVSSSQGAVNYALGDVPHVEAPDLAGPETFLHASSSTGFHFVGLVASGSVGQVFPTAFTSSFVGQELYESTCPSLATSLVTIRGQGAVEFRLIDLGASELNSAPGCRLRLIQSRLHASGVSLVGGRIELDQSLVIAESGSISITDRAEVVADRSLFQTRTQKIFVRDDSHLETGATTFWSSSIEVQSSRMVASIPGTSGSAMVASNLVMLSDSDVDARNMISSGTVPAAGPFIVRGQSVNLFFNEATPPTGNPVSINNGINTSLSWSQMPWNDMLRNVRAVSGSLQNAW